jgi:hypothetical protein
VAVPPEVVYPVSQAVHASFPAEVLYFPAMQAVQVTPSLVLV